MSRAYEILEPVFRVLPEVSKPARRLSIRERLVWTALVLITYLAMSQIPLYGIPWRETQYQTFFFLQVIMASRRGTLMELGIGPIVTAGIIWELLVGSKIIEIDLTTKEGRRLFAGVQKILAIIFAGVEAAAYILGGAYGALSLTSQVIVFAQLMVASVIVLLMDEMLQKGWGLGSGVSLFIAVGVAQQIFWELFSPLGPMADGLFYGLVPSITYALYRGVSEGNWTLAQRVIWRRGYPDVVGLIATIAFILMLAYFESMRIDIPVAASRYGGARARIPLKFLYVSNLPVILVSALYADVHIFAQALWPRLNPNNSNPWLNYIMMYNKTAEGQLIPMKGSLVYYITPPRRIWGAMEDPVHFAIYASLFLIFSILFAVAWVVTSGMDPESQAEQLVKAQLHIPGFRRSPKILASILRRHVWPLTILSGIIVGLIAVAGDLLGVLGSGIGILLMIGILIQYQALLAREQALEMYPMLAKLIGE